MKKIFGLLTLAALLATPALALGAGQVGVYVAPKFVYGYTLLDGMKSVNDSGSWAKGSKSDNAFGGALALGYDFNKKFQVPLRAELEYAVFSEVSGKNSRWNDFYYDYYRQKLNIQNLFLNAYYDFRNSTAFTPYLGLGLGVAFIKDKGRWTNSYDSDSFSHGAKSSSNFAWNIGAGLAYDFTDRFSLDLGYRFAGLGKAETKESIYNYGLKTKNVYMHQLLLGARFTF